MLKEYNKLLQFKTLLSKLILPFSIFSLGSMKLKNNLHSPMTLRLSVRKLNEKYMGKIQKKVIQEIKVDVFLGGGMEKRMRMCEETTHVDESMK